MVFRAELWEDGKAPRLLSEHATFDAARRVRRVNRIVSDSTGPWTVWARQEGLKPAHPLDEPGWRYLGRADDL